MLGFKSAFKMVVFTIMMSVIILPSVKASASETVISEKTKSNENFNVTTQVCLKYSVNQRGVVANIFIENRKDSDFSGTVYIKQNDHGFIINKYEINIDSGEKVCLSEELSLLNDKQTYLYVKIKNQNNKEVYNDYFNVYVENQSLENRYNVGVLSEDKDFIYNNIDIIKRYSNWYFDFSMNDDKIDYYKNFPKEGKISGFYDVFIIDGYDTKKLSKEDVDTLIKFVDEGGVLILGTGEKTADVLDGFGNLIDYTYKGTIDKILDKKQIAGDMYVSYEIGKYYDINTDRYDYDDFIDEWDTVWRDYYKGIDISKKYSYYDWTAKEPEYMVGDDKFVFKEAEIKINNSSYETESEFFTESVIEKGEGKIIIVPFSIKDCADFVNIDKIVKDDDFVGDIAPECIVEKSDRTSISIYIILSIIYIIIVIASIVYVTKKMKKSYLSCIAIFITAVVFSVVFYGAARKMQMGDMLGYVTLNTYYDTGKVVSVTEFCLVNQENSKYQLGINSPNMIYATDYSVSDYDGYYYVNGNRGIKEKWDESEGIIFDRTNQTDNQKITINKLAPYSMCNFGFSSVFKGEGCFKFEKKEDEYLLCNNTGKDLKCAVIMVDGRYKVLGDLKQNEEILIPNLMLEDNDIDYTSFVSDDVDDKMAMSIVRQYRNIANNRSGVNIFAIESFDSEYFSNDWTGMTIVSQKLGDEEDFGIISIDAFENDGVIVGDYDIDAVYDWDDSVQDIIWLNSDAIVLYDIPKDKKLKSVRVNVDKLKKIENDEYGYSLEDMNPVMQIYNYKTDSYDVLYNKKESRVITETSDYYGENKPVRIKLKNVAVMPDITLEVE